MQASPELLASIERLYEVFSGYPLPEEIDYCRCGCNRAEHVSVLYSKPLRELGRDELEFYAFCALTTMGNVSDFKHFLPKLFYLTFAAPAGSQLIIDCEILTGKLNYGKWRTWPEAEQDALRNFLHVLWTNVLADLSWRYIDCNYIEDIVCAIAQTQESLTPFLDEWIKAENIEACVTLAWLLVESDMVSVADPEAFWTNCPMQHKQLRDWILSPNVAAKLEAAAERWADTNQSDEFKTALDVLGKKQ